MNEDERELVDVLVSRKRREYSPCLYGNHVLYRPYARQLYILQTHKSFHKELCESVIRPCDGDDSSIYPMIDLRIKSSSQFSTR